MLRAAGLLATAPSARTRSGYVCQAYPVYLSVSWTHVAYSDVFSMYSCSIRTLTERVGPKKPLNFTSIR